MSQWQVLTTPDHISRHRSHRQKCSGSCHHNDQKYCHSKISELFREHRRTYRHIVDRKRGVGKWQCDELGNNESLGSGFWDFNSIRIMTNTTKACVANELSALDSNWYGWRFAGKKIECHLNIVRMCEGLVGIWYRLCYVYPTVFSYTDPVLRPDDIVLEGCE